MVVSVPRIRASRQIWRTLEAIWERTRYHVYAAGLVLSGMGAERRLGDASGQDYLSMLKIRDHGRERG